MFTDAIDDMACSIACSANCTCPTGCTAENITFSANAILSTKCLHRIRFPGHSDASAPSAATSGFASMNAAGSRPAAA